MAESTKTGAVASGDQTQADQTTSTKPADEGKQSKKGGKNEVETPSPTQAELDELKQRLARGGNYKNRAQTAG